MKRKSKDLQPWLDYFGMLRTYEQNGFLQIEAEKHEVYVTQPALHAMTDGDDPRKQIASGAILHTIRRLRAYAGWRSQAGEKCLKQPFAVHVVTNDEQHDLLYTVLLTYRRPWWCMGFRREHVETISY